MCEREKETVFQTRDLRLKQYPLVISDTRGIFKNNTVIGFCDINQVLHKGCTFKFFFYLLFNREL